MINRVILGGLFSFPYGEAASSRIRNLALGFKSHVDDVSIISLFHNDQTDTFKQNHSGVFDGVSLKYQCIAPSIKDTSDLLQRGIRRFTYFKYYPKLIDKILNKLRGDEHELLFLYGRSYLFLNTLLKKISELNLKTKIVFDVVEPPRTSKSVIEYIFHPFAWDSVLVFKKLLGKFQCCTFISHTLKNKYGHLTQGNYVMPSMAFTYKQVSHKTLITNLKLGYIGGLIDKDYPQLMLEVCRELYNRRISFELYIIGRYEAYKEGRCFSEILKKSIFSNQIRFFNNPSEEEKVAIINSFDYMFCLRKPDMVQYYTFPTRVTEALSLGKVLILNNYGDYIQYFEDNQNSIMIEPGNIDSAVDKIIKSMNINKYNYILNNGIKLLDGAFNSGIQCGNLLRDLG